MLEHMYASNEENKIEYNHLEHRVFQWILNISKLITHIWQSNVDTSYISIYIKT